MAKHRIFYRRHLPHYQPAGATLFVTFRLYGSLSQEQLEVPERPPAASRSPEGATFARRERMLDCARSGPRWLADEEVAAMVAQSLHHLDGERYDLLAYCIMPNHVHVVFTLPAAGEEERNSSLSSIMQSIKGYTARRANQMLGRRGQFWQDESYDRVIRDGAELERVLRYVINNPVKAGLVSTACDWKWTFCRWEL